MFRIVDNGSSPCGKRAADRLAAAFPNTVTVHASLHASRTDQVAAGAPGTSGGPAASPVRACGQLGVQETVGQVQLPLGCTVTPQLLPLPSGFAVST